MHASARNEGAGSVVQDAGQDTVMSEVLMGAEPVPVREQDDEDRAKRQRTEETEKEMDVSNVSKIKDSRRILHLRGGNWRTTTTVTQRCSAPVN